MKLATLKDDYRDGTLVVVSRDLTRCAKVEHIAPTLQNALDNWKELSPRLQEVAEGIETGAQPSQRFHERSAHSPLPRAFHFALSGDGGTTAHLSRLDSGAFAAPRDPVHLPAGHKKVAVHAAVVVLIGDVSAGASTAQAREAIRLVTLASEMFLPGAMPQSADVQRLAAAFAPVAVTPDELGAAWDGDHIMLPVMIGINGKPSSPMESGATAVAGLSVLIAHAAAHAALCAGTIVGAAAIDPAGLMQAGDTVRIEMKDKGGHSMFGAIERKLETV